VTAVTDGIGLLAHFFVYFEARQKSHYNLQRAATTNKVQIFKKSAPKGHFIVQWDVGLLYPTGWDGVFFKGSVTF
jgi:hypothetical protein